MHPSNDSGIRYTVKKKKKKCQLLFQFTGLGILSSELVILGSELLSVLGRSWGMGLFFTMEQPLL